MLATFQRWKSDGFALKEIALSSPATYVLSAAVAGELVAGKTTFDSGEQIMTGATRVVEKLNPKMLALFLVGGTLGAIIMSWVSYARMIGRAL
jgi:hypothetical protein